MRRPWGTAAIIAVLAIGGTATWFFFHRKLVLTEKGTVVLGDFDNSTGDAVFDGTLRQGLAVQLDQSPFLNQVSEGRIRQTLALMGKPADQRLTPEVGREVCQRTGGVAVLNGSIASLGSQYILGLRAVDCRTGDVLAEEQETAGSKEKILAALDKSAEKVREKLGESFSTVEKFDTPLEEATTSSLEALQAYTLGRQMMVGKDQFAEAIPFFQRAIQIDPNFAMASAALGSVYRTLGESELADGNIQRAYEGRAHLSQPEQFYIEGTYYHYFTHNLEKARQVYELAAQTYPRYSGTHLRLWLLYRELGDHEKSLAEIREAIRLDPTRTIDYVNLIDNLVTLGRFQEARNEIADLQSKHEDPPTLHATIYNLDFLEGDLAGMQEQLKWPAGSTVQQTDMLALEAETCGYAGQIKRARDLSRQARDSSIQARREEVAAVLDASQALWESLVGNKAEARQNANLALQLSKGREVTYQAALALAFTGDEARAQSLVEEESKRFPDDTRIRFDLLPIISAKVALSHNDPAGAVSLLIPSVPYELGIAGTTRLAPIYVRGEAYLAAHRWVEAAAEFQKILDHPGIVINHPFRALAHLEMGRAYAGAGDKDKARLCYDDFLKLWKDADAEVPLLKDARAEYAKL
jgi:tetratricopeptide (TPR) repeat protein